MCLPSAVGSAICECVAARLDLFTHAFRWLALHVNQAIGGERDEHVGARQKWWRFAHLHFMKLLLLGMPRAPHTHASSIDSKSQ